MLESASHAEARSAPVYATYVGGSFAHQAWQEVLPDLPSARLRDVIIDALTAAGITSESLDLIIPHGAGTRWSDRYEASCLEMALAGKPCNAIATAFKPNIGHTLAASGILETICALLALRHQLVPATLHSRPEHVRFPVPLATSPTDRPIRTILKMSTGFSGHDTALVFRAS